MSTPLPEGWAKARYGRLWHWWIGDEAYCHQLHQIRVPHQPTLPHDAPACTACQKKLSAPRAGGHKEQA